MKDGSDTDALKPNWWKRLGLLAAAGWLVALAYLLLTGDPPDFWFDDIGTVDGPGHVVAGFVTGLVVYLFLARRRRALVLAMLITAALLIGLEVVQDVFTDRGYEQSDVVLSLVGAVAGVAAAGAGVALASRRRPPV